MWLVRDISPGAGGSDPADLTLAGTVLYFSADDGVSGRELWKSDGNEPGTVLVKDANPGPSGSEPAYLTVMSGTLFFSAVHPDSGREFWRSDGSSIGTLLVKDINPGPGGSEPLELADMGAAFSFSADDGANGRELWTSDGTEAGTLLAGDINPGGGSDPQGMVAVGGVLLFAADDGASGRELWRLPLAPADSELTFAVTTTAARADVAPGDGRCADAEGRCTLQAAIQEANALDANVTIVLPAGGYGSSSMMAEYYAFHIEAGGSVRILGEGADTTKMVEASNSDAGLGLLQIASGAVVSIQGVTLSRHSDARRTNNGILNSGALTLEDSTITGGGFRLTAFVNNGTATLRNVTVRQSGDRSIRSSVIRRNSGGTAGGIWGSVHLIDSIVEDNAGGDAGGIYGGGTLENSIVRGNESGTSLGGPGYGQAGGLVGSFTLINSVIIDNTPADCDTPVKADETSRDSDGTCIPPPQPPHEEMVKDINPGRNDANPSALADVNGILYFSADDGVHGRELWTSDGTEAGTVLFMDINPGPGHASPRNFAVMDGTLYLVADDGVHGDELWKSDGTEQGTVLVKDITPGTEGVGPLNLTDVNGVLFFVADDGVNGWELWKSDGTEAGTVMVKDISPGAGDGMYPFGTFRGEVVNVNGVLFFVADDGANGLELWKSDGTEQGTVLVKDIYPGASGSGLHELTDVDGTLFFSANNGVNGEELWKSDGTGAGTVMVRDINPGPKNSFTGNLTNLNGTLFFAGNDGAHGQALWKSDGTAAGTVLVKAVNLFYPDPDLTAVGGVLFFVADDGVAADAGHGNELWRSDGTAAGTVMVKDIKPGRFRGSFARELTDGNGTLFFSADDGVHNRELWKSDGTEAGTLMVKDFFPGSVASEPKNLTLVGGSLFFSADDGVFGRELYMAPAPEPTLESITVGPDNAAMPVGQTRQFTAMATYSHGVTRDVTAEATWTSSNQAVATVSDSGLVSAQSQGTAAITAAFDGEEDSTTLTVLALEMLKDIRPGADGSFANELLNVNGTLFLGADDGIDGYELWKSDGTEAGTVMVKDIWPGSGSGFPQDLVGVGDTVFFRALHPNRGRELWRSDGTEAGTIMVKDINPGGSSSPTYITHLNGVLYFTADDGVHGSELWRSDGTEAGTVLVKDIRPGPDGSFTGNLTDFNGTLFFYSNDGVNGQELWKSDGTEAGTVMVKDINPGPASSSPYGLVNFNGALFFRADDGVNGTELWKSDGTEAGTVLVKDINPGSGSSVPGDLANIGGALFFRANDGAKGIELWKSDGTEAGTVLVKDIHPGIGDSGATDMTDFSGILVFRAWDGTSGSELWRSDGTEAGTFMVRDINPGSGDSTLSNLAVADGALFFNANDGVHGFELWKSDGTEVGTFLLSDINPGSAHGGPAHLTVVGDLLLFTAIDGAHGREPWKLVLRSEPQPILESIAVSPASAEIEAGQTQQFTATGTYSDGSTADVTAEATWTSSDETVATVDGNGLATGQSEGEATITAALYGKEGTATLTVTAPAPGPVSKTVPVSASSDDAFAQINAGWPGYSATSPGIYAGAPGSNGPVAGGWRFTGLDIPAGATIVEAYVELNQHSWGDGVTTTLAFENAAAPTTFSADSTPADRLDNRTAFSVSWMFESTGPGTWHQTPALAAGLQELLDAHGAIQQVVLLEDGTGMPQGMYHYWASFDSGPAVAATLSVTYSTATEPEPTLESITVSPATAEIPVGETQQFTATGTYSDGSTKDVTEEATWTSSDEAVATVDASGLATGQSEGEATITATLDGVEGAASLTITAPQPALESITVSPAAAEIPVGETQQFTATGTYSDGSTKDVTAEGAWASSDEAVATVDGTGLARGQSAGEATITATLDGVEGTASLTVTASGPPPEPGTVTRTVAVNASSDDAFAEINGGWPGYSATSPGIYAGAPGSNGPVVGGWRFTGLDIPAGATIIEAHAELNQYGWGHDVTTTLTFEDSAAPATFSSGSTPADRLPNRTAFNASWAFDSARPGTWFQTPSLAAGLQELVDTYGDIQHVVLLEDGTGVPQGNYHYWASFDSRPDVAARLVVTYSTAAKE